MGSLGNPGTLEVKNLAMTSREPLALSRPSAGPMTMTGFTVASSNGAGDAPPPRTKSHAARSASTLLRMYAPTPLPLGSVQSASVYTCEAGRSRP